MFWRFSILLLDFLSPFVFLWVLFNVAHAIATLSEKKIEDGFFCLSTKLKEMFKEIKNEAGK